ncbi:PurE domain [Sesbania bispinosa]|nr:PurE domain [Sesbania bispinosa]
MFFNSYASSARDRGIKVIIAGAGGATHLPGMLVALTPLSVIGVPVRASTLDGLLLSIVQVWSMIRLGGASTIAHLVDDVPVSAVELVEE